MTGSREQQFYVYLYERLIGRLHNGDAHLKNWSLIYHDRHNPTLAPAIGQASRVRSRWH